MLIETSLAPGWRAGLGLRIERRGSASILAQRNHYGPLRVQKALYPEGGAVCHLIMLHPPGGIVGGDELDIEVRVEQNAHALLTTPGAGKWYRSAGTQARQTLRLEVASGALLEWLPQESIFFSGCRAQIDNRISLAKNARFLGWDVWCLGRAASGERFDQGELRVTTEISLGDTPLWLEQGRLTGASPLLQSPVGFAGRSVSGTLLAAGAVVTPELLAACRGLMPVENDALYGITVLPTLLVARYLGNSPEAARAWFIELWRLLRPVLSGAEVQLPRIWST